MNEDFEKEYYRTRQVYPKCFEKSILKTLVGISIQEEGDRDDNRATCTDCGWIGIVHDLVKEN